MNIHEYQAKAAAEAMIGNVLITKQTGEAGCDIKRELLRAISCAHLKAGPI
jgi:hypothetical protein